MKRIVYKNKNGGVSIIIPAPKSPLTLEQIAAKDVPTGVPYKILDLSEIPESREFRDAWDIDEKELTDGAGE